MVWRPSVSSWWPRDQKEPHDSSARGRPDTRAAAGSGAGPGSGAQPGAPAARAGARSHRSDAASRAAAARSGLNRHPCRAAGSKDWPLAGHKLLPVGRGGWRAVGRRAEGDKPA